MRVRLSAMVKSSSFLYPVILLSILLVCYQAHAREATDIPTLGQPCITLDPEGTTLDIIGFGGALFGDFRFNSREDKAELFNTICLQGEEGWQLEASSLLVENLSTTPSFSAQYGRLNLADWRLAAQDIISAEGSIELSQARFYNDTARGEAEHISYDVTTGEATLQELYAVAGNYRIEGARGRLYSTDLIFEDALATTCLCDDDKLYVVIAPEVNIDLLAQRILIEDGVLRIGDTRIELEPDLLLDENSFKNFEPPISVRYDGNEAGNGLEVLTRLGLAQGTVFEFGVVGFNGKSQERIFGVVKVSQPGVSATVGYAKDGGWQVDARFEQALSEDFILDFGVNNRYFASQNYLSEGYIGLSSRQVINLYDNISLSLTPRIFAALTSQQFAKHTFGSARLGAALPGNLSVPSPIGNFALAFNAQITSYPSQWYLPEDSEQDAWQYGLYLKPSWLLKLSELETRLSYERRWTNGASPFTKAVDKLAEVSTLAGSASFTRGNVPDFDKVSYQDRALVQDNFSFALSANGVYDFLQDTSKANPVRKLAFSISSTWRYEQILLQAALNLETAALFSEFYDEKVEARFEGELTANFASGMALGLRSRYYLEPKLTKDKQEQPLLDVLELNALYPFTLGEFTFEPYLGLNFAPLLNNTGALGISSHGLMMSWENCCGTMALGYRQVDDITTISIALSVDSDNRPEVDPEEFASLAPDTNSSADEDAASAENSLGE